MGQRITEIVVGQGFILNGCPVRVVESTTKKTKLAFGAEGVTYDLQFPKPGDKFLTPPTAVE